MSFDPITLVRRFQASLSRDLALASLEPFIARESSAQAAKIVVEHYFRMAIAAGNDAVVNQLIELYQYSFVLAPLARRVPGAYGVGWDTERVLSWVRKSMTKRTRQFYFCQLDFTSTLTRDPVNVSATLTERIGVKDQLFVKSATQILCDLSASEGRKSKAARLFLDPFVLEQDWLIAERFNTRTHGASRIRARAEKKPVGSYLRRSENGLLIADRATALMTPDLQWKNIFGDVLTVGDYRVTWDQVNDRLDLRVDRRVIEVALREVKLSASAATSPAAKLSAIRRAADSFFARHAFAINSSADLTKAEREIDRLVRKHVTATNPNLIWRRQKEVYTRLAHVIPHPFHDVASVDEKTWMTFWNPYR